MPAIAPPAAMVETPMPPVLTAARSGCKRNFGALAARSEIDSSPGSACLRREPTQAAFFAFVGVPTAWCGASGRRAGCRILSTAGDSDAG